MEKKDYIIGIDVGSSNVVMTVGTRNEKGEISILGVEVQPINDCVVDGDVTNFIELGKAIKEAKEALEKDSEIKTKVILTRTDDDGFYNGGNSNTYCWCRIIR